jgi:broad specificity phosphatase PhoE
VAIILVRHGETNENHAQIVQHAEVGLSKRGHEQAKLLAKALQKFDIQHVLSSDLPRTRQTSDHYLGSNDTTVNYTPWLRERNFGDLRGKHYTEIGYDFTEEELSPKHGENKAVFAFRVKQAWLDIQARAKRCSGDLLVVSHGLVCRTLVANHLTLKDGVELPAKWENTSITVFEDASPFQVSILNDASHLDERNRSSTGSAAV